MIIAPYNQSKPHDDLLPKIIKSVKERIEGGEDDAIVVCFGTAGTGKTTLMFWSYVLYAENPMLSRIALTRKDFANALNTLTEPSPDRFVGYDEGNVSKREAMTKWNREIIDLYFSIRGKGALHWWNNPSLDYLERTFIEERVKFVIHCFSKSRTVRKYRLFTKDSVLRMLQKEGDLKTWTDKKKGEKYAVYEGWFKAYKGDLWKEYLAKKEDRMNEKITEFNSRWGVGATHTLTTAASLIGCTTETFKKAAGWGTTTGKLLEGQDYILKGNRIVYTDKGVEKCREIVLAQPYTVLKGRKPGFRGL